MASTIKIKRGLKTNLPTLAVGELGYCTDTNEVFIGTSGGNVLINEDTDVSTEYSKGVIEEKENNNTNFWIGTQAEYDALSTYDNNTLYFIEE